MKTPKKRRNEDSAWIRTGGFQSLEHWMSAALDLPDDVAEALPRVFWMGRELYVDNHLGLLEFSETSIRFHTQLGTLRVRGHGLKLGRLGLSQAEILGNISGVEFHTGESSEKR